MPGCRVDPRRLGIRHIRAELVAVRFDSSPVHAMTSPPLSSRRPVDLTPAEYRVCRALAIDGADNKTIAKRLFCTEDTVKSHIKHALAKTGCTDRAGLIAAIWSGRIEIITTPHGCETRFLLRELWSMLGHPSVIDASESA